MYSVFVLYLLLVIAIYECYIIYFYLVIEKKVIIVYRVLPETIKISNTLKLSEWDLTLIKLCTMCPKLMWSAWEPSKLQLCWRRKCFENFVRDVIVIASSSILSRPSIKFLENIWDVAMLLQIMRCRQSEPCQQCARFVKPATPGFKLGPAELQATIDNYRAFPELFMKLPTNPTAGRKPQVW